MYVDNFAVILLAGPTASGKSALALALAEKLGGTIINADSMQVYSELRILTARPSPEDEARGIAGTHNGTSEVSVRGQFRAWLAAMTADAAVR